jgi:hypothetical protein
MDLAEQTRRKYRIEVAQPGFIEAHEGGVVVTVEGNFGDAMGIVQALVVQTERALAVAANWGTKGIKDCMEAGEPAARVMGWEFTLTQLADDE